MKPSKGKCKRVSTFFMVIIQQEGSTRKFKHSSHMRRNKNRQMKQHKLFFLCVIQGLVCKRSLPVEFCIPVSKLLSFTHLTVLSPVHYTRWWLEGVWFRGRRHLPVQLRDVNDGICFRTACFFWLVEVILRYPRCGFLRETKRF